jgi:Rrf2 family iron-sulfur cluster assembly transcriptional regulator
MADISVADIIYAVDEPIDATQCKGKENCLDDHRCLTHDLWANLNHHMVEYLDSVTLHDLVAQQRDRLRRQQELGHVGVLRDHRGGAGKDGITEPVPTALPEAAQASPT